MRENAILNKLLDRYENSLIRHQKNNRAITEPISKKSLPAYFDQKRLDYLEINERLETLEKSGAIEITWKNKRKGHIIEKIRLIKPELLYQYLKRTPLVKKYEKLNTLIESLEEEYGESQFVESYLSIIREKINEGKSIKKYVDLDHLEDFSKFIKLLFSVEKNENVCFIREFSVKHFSDSKYLERNKRKLTSTIHLLTSEEIEKDDDETLADYLIYPNPSYIYLKGTGTFELEDSTINLEKLEYGIALAEEDIKKLRFSDLGNVKDVITIENLTSFYRFKREESLCIYIGGFHNRIHDQFLKELYSSYDNLHYLHFGDIDAGGFYIFLDLLKKTEIPFKTLHMNSDILERYEKYANELTGNDKRRIEKLISALENDEWNFLEREERERLKHTLKFMLKCGKKLEQEALFWEN